MTIWMKNRGIAAVVAALIIAEMIASLTLATRFQLPSLLGLQGMEVPIGFFLPMVAIIGFGVSMERRPRVLEIRSARLVRVWDCLFGAVLVGLVALPSVWQGPATWLAAALSTATGVGMVMALKHLPPATRSIIPCGWIIVGVLTGRSYGHDAWWNWPVAPPASPVALSWAVIGMGLGILIHTADRWMPRE